MECDDSEITLLSQPSSKSCHFTSSITADDQDLIELEFWHHNLESQAQPWIEDWIISLDNCNSYGMCGPHGGSNNLTSPYSGCLKGSPIWLQQKETNANQSYLVNISSTGCVRYRLGAYVSHEPMMSGNKVSCISIDALVLITAATITELAAYE
ncbi:S-locus glycoprotein [Cynara cardunculus var. scolymus]|uniref:S-locus glycoprotein n=1 Tax=Cynara cardunculus var. scolymus TaxID=59895 RepID=A0A103YIM3_CYNCS|nr:S-locus glycoprotein [Cynara cardunculus var. scolymus]